MKKTIFILAVLALFWGCVGQAVQTSMPTERVIPSRLKLRIVCPKTTVKFGEPVSIMIMMQKLVDDEIEAPTAYWSAIVKIDGKEFKNLNTGCPPWDGPGIVPKGFEIGIGATLSESYGISKETLSIGTHKVSVRIDNDVSNTLTIAVVGDK